jgi:hypothetical protein
VHKCVFDLPLLASFHFPLPILLVVSLSPAYKYRRPSSVHNHHSRAHACAAGQQCFDMCSSRSARAVCLHGSTSLVMCLYSTLGLLLILVLDLLFSFSSWCTLRVRCCACTPCTQASWRLASARLPQICSCSGSTSARWSGTATLTNTASVHGPSARKSARAFSLSTAASLAWVSTLWPTHCRRVQD